MSIKRFLDLSRRLSAAEMESAVAALRDCKNHLSRFAVSLSDEERKGRRTVAEGREGYVRELWRISHEYESELPRSFALTDYTALLELYDEWKRLKVLAEETAELIDDPVLALGVELMSPTDLAHRSLQNARDLNASLDRALESIDDYNRRYVTDAPAPPPVAPPAEPEA